MTQTKKPDLSIVVPVLNEADNLEPLYADIHRTLDTLSYTWELLFVDDGSSDGSWETIRGLYAREASIRAVRFSRNFGHQSALMAGLRAADGRAVISMDADLQHPPALIGDMLKEWENGFQIVHTERLDSPSTPMLKRLSSRAFYRLFTFLSGVAIRPGSADFRLLDRRVVEHILEFKEQRPLLRVIVHDIGYPQTTLTFDPSDRNAGKSKYTLKRMFTMAWEGLSGYTQTPLRLSIYMGMITSVAAFGGVIYALYSKFVLDSVVPGWASLLSIISILFGMLFFMVGVLGEYVGRILQEVTERPRYLVMEELRPTPPRPPTGDGEPE